MKVACLLVTRERRIFAHRAFEYFRRQTYRKLELVVVESGPRWAFSDRNPLDEHENVLLIQSHAPLTQATGLSLAHQQSNADIFVQWDDDDWQSPERVANLVDDLEHAYVTGTTNLLAFDVLSGRGMRWPGHSQMACGSTFAYRRELVERFPWNPNLGRQSDTEWLGRLRGAGVAIHDNGRASDIIYVLHHRNVTPQTAQVANALHDEANGLVRELMGDDARWYDELRECLPPRRKGSGDFPNVFFEPWGR